MTEAVQASPTQAKARARLLAFLAKGPAELAPAASDRLVVIAAASRGEIAVAPALIDGLAKEGLVRRDGGKISITAAGRKMLAKRRAAAKSAEVVRQPEGAASPRINLDESPLAQLVRLRTRDGKPFLEEAEWRAGERLRSDYTRGQLVPRLGANWQAAVASGRRSSGAGGAVDLTDAALAARQRVNHAIDAVGPELAGVLIDICCFLKGFSTVEIERGWPVRSAKVVLKTALGALSRHYEPAPRQRRAAFHWGAADYRPVINGSGGPGQR